MVQQPLYARPGWLAAHARVVELLHTAEERIASPAELGPDAICDAATAAQLDYDFVLLPNPWRQSPATKHSPMAQGKPWDSWSNETLFDIVFEEHPPSPDPLWLVLDDCFGEREPHLVSGGQLREFAASYGSSLSVDVLFIWCRSRRISIIHHEGGYAHIFIPGVTDPDQGLDPPEPGSGAGLVPIVARGEEGQGITIETRGLIGEVLFGPLGLLKS